MSRQSDKSGLWVGIIAAAFVAGAYLFAAIVAAYQ